MPATNDCASSRHPVRTVARREQVAAVPPGAEVHVPPVADLAGNDDRREGRLPAVPGADAADGLARQDHQVGRLHRVAVTERDLQLARGVLGVELVDTDALLLERGDQIGDEVRELREDDRAVGRAAMRRHQPAVLLLAAGEPLDLAAHRQVQALRRRPVDHAPQERPLADRGDLALLREPVGRPPGPAGLRRQDANRVRVHHQPVVAGGPAHLVARRDVVVHQEHVEDRRQPDARADRALEQRDRDRLHAGDPGVVHHRDGNRADPARRERLRQLAGLGGPRHLLFGRHSAKPPWVCASFHGSERSSPGPVLAEM